MKGRLYRVIVSFIIVSILCISGCSNNNEYYEYSSVNSSVADVASVVSGVNLYNSEPFSKDICVIPKSEVGQNISDNLIADGILNVDITDNKVLCSKGIYDKMYPASLTKLGTALVCFRYGNMSDDVVVSEKAVNINVPGAKMCFLQEGDVINFKVLLTSFLVYSGNDAGVALAEHISGSEKEFCRLMNEELKKIGAVNTNFINCHGLPEEEHYTSVYDVYLMLNELAKYNEFTEITSMESYTAKFKDKNGRDITKVYESTDKYLTGEKSLPKGVKILAGKTGTTNDAGYCLAVLSEKKKTSHQYISIVMKAYSSDSLYNQMTELLKMK